MLIARETNVDQAVALRDESELVMVSSEAHYGLHLAVSCLVVNISLVKVRKTLKIAAVVFGHL